MAKPRIDTPGQDDPDRGRRLEINVGNVRVGVTVSGPNCILTTPIETVTRITGQKGPDGPGIDRLMELATGLEVIEIVVGMSIMLDGSFGTSTRKATDAGFWLQRRLSDRAVVYYVDGRMTTVMTQSRLHAAGIDIRSGREIINRAVTVEVLQSWLDKRAGALDGITD